ncbi:MAG: hypothetical protein AAF436_06390 [Myxococcota bacterium]
MPRSAMHGLRCSPTLVGWTRLLDEWVVGLTSFNRPSDASATCWEDPVSTRATLVAAADRARSFALSSPSEDRLAFQDDGTLRVELQGCRYVVCTDQTSPIGGTGFEADALNALDRAATRAQEAAAPAEHPVGVVFVTPVMDAGLAPEKRAAAADAIIADSRRCPTSAAAYSFPSPAETDRYHYVNDEYPGALVLVRSVA